MKRKEPYQIGSFRKKASNCRSLLWKMTYQDVAFYGKTRCAMEKKELYQIGLVPQKKQNMIILVFWERPIWERPIENMIILFFWERPIYCALFVERALSDRTLCFKIYWSLPKKSTIIFSTL